MMTSTKSPIVNWKKISPGHFKEIFVQKKAFLGNLEYLFAQKTIFGHGDVLRRIFV